jgi:NTE family protein
MRAMKLDAVFEGGGVRGIGLVGALKVVEDNDYQIEHVAGASAGAIVAALVASRYTADEIRSIIFDIDFSRLTDLSGVGALPGLGKLFNILTKLGIYEGDYFLRLIRELLKKQGVATFGDLRMKEFEGDLRYRYKLRVVRSDVSRGIKVVLPQEIKAYGVDPMTSR